MSNICLWQTSVYVKSGNRVTRAEHCFKSNISLTPVAVDTLCERDILPDDIYDYAFFKCALSIFNRHREKDPFKKTKQATGPAAATVIFCPTAVLFLFGTRIFVICSVN